MSKFTNGKRRGNRLIDLTGRRFGRGKVVDPTRRSNAVRDRAATLATTVLQIINTAPATTVVRELENYLRDELADVAQIAAERELPDA